MTPVIQNDQLDEINWSLCCGVPLLVILLMSVGTWYFGPRFERMAAELDGLTVKEFREKSKEPKTPRDRAIDSVILTATLGVCYLLWHYILVPVLVFLSKQ